MTISDSLGSIPCSGGWEAAWPDADSLRERIAHAAFRAASYLTEPVCKGHELFRRLTLVDALDRLQGRAEAAAKKIILGIAMAGCLAAGLFTALPGIALRSFASSIQKHPYIHIATGRLEKELPADGSFSLFTWNVCCVGGGYPISDGGVLPWQCRIGRISERICEMDADVVCLNEIFDFKAGDILTDKLREAGYSHIYFNFGAKGVGSPGGLFVASKFAIEKGDFEPFPQEMLIGRTKHCAKGVFGFDLASGGKPFARIFATHLQHSEEPEFPTGEEVDARRRQMALIAAKAEWVGNRAVLVTGDLNLDDAEYRQSFWKERFERVEPRTEFTWGGDGFCAKLVGRKRISGPLNLDYTLALKGSAKSVDTRIVGTGFDGAVFSEEALSDHAGLFSKIILPSRLP